MTSMSPSGQWVKGVCSYAVNTLSQSGTHAYWILRYHWFRGSHNGLSPVRRQTFIETNVGLLSIQHVHWLMVPSHYLNQLWLDISDPLWHSTERNVTATDQVNILYNKFQNYTLEVTDTYPRGEYVKTKESAPRQHNGTQGSLCLAPANQLAANKQPLWYSIPSTLVVLCFKRWSYCLHALFRGYPAKRALSAMRKHGG